MYGKEATISLIKSLIDYNSNTKWGSALRYAVSEIEKKIDNDLPGVVNSKIQETKGLPERISKLVDFLDECDESKVSAGDVMGYICGYVDITSAPEDEIETFD